MSLEPEEALDRFGQLVKTSRGLHVDANCTHIKTTRIIIEHKSQLPLRGDVCSVCDPTAERDNYTPDDLCVPAIEDAKEVSD